MSGGANPNGAGAAGGGQPHGSAPAAPSAVNPAELQSVLSEVLSLRGATAAAFVTVDGELLASRSHDRALLEQTVSMITSALAAGTALGELFGAAAAPEGELGEAATPAGSFMQITLVFGDGPVLLTLLPGGAHVMVLALDSEGDLGRARLALKGRLGALAGVASRRETGNLMG